MSKVFLSHSSFDKDFVEKVYAELGAARCVYDVKTFEKNCDLPMQIREGLEDCDVYALFLSATAVKSNWVTSELDIALELRTRWKIRKFLVFQLDDTKWDTLPPWMGRYVVSCPPSPRQVVLRLMNEVSNASSANVECHGRSEDERRIVDLLSDPEVPPSYLYISGPNGIGRRTIASKVYESFYPNVSSHKIEITVDQVDDTLDIYRRALAYSANWRANDYKQELDRYVELSPTLRSRELAKLLRDISITFGQVVIINLGTAALTEEGKPQAWFASLTKYLAPADYPYIWFISQRFLNGSDLSNGLFLSVDSLDEKWSTFLFRILIKKYGIAIPSKDEQSRIETSISGHPGLITMVANYLRRNPNYKPNRTHNNVVKLINEQVQQILFDFVGTDTDREQAVALFAEANILSYGEIQNISREWPSFETCTESLIDAGLLARVASDYSLVTYIQRASEGLATKHRAALAPIRKALLADFDTLEDNSYLSIQLLDARIVAHILDGTPLAGYLSNLVMPSQQIRAAKRRYDSQDYEGSLKLAKQAYEQTEKLSENGRREAWRLMGLSAVRANLDDQFQVFVTEYSRIKSSPQTDAIYNFGNGLRERLRGNLRQALVWYKKINQDRYADSHVYRELAYIYAFERSFDEAYSCVTKAHDLAFGNPYVLDILAMVLLERFKAERRGVSITDIDTCLDQLKAADERDGTTFFSTRSRMREVIVNNDLASLHDLFSNRRALPIAAKLALLSMLSLKEKDLQFNELHGELTKALREKRNPLAKIEMSRVDIEHHCARRQFDQAEKLLRDNRSFFPQRCCDELERLFPGGRATRK